jgi:phosphoribulokinase
MKFLRGSTSSPIKGVAMKKAVAVAEAQGNKNLSHFGPDANEFDKIEKTFKDYGTTGQCDRRY